MPTPSKHSGATCLARLAIVAAMVLVAAAAPRAFGAGDAEGGFWPQFHGPALDNLSTEKGLLKQWPEGGPKLAWKLSDCGAGYSGVAIADGRLYTVGDFADKESLFALDLGGKRLWTADNGRSWKGAMPGCRTTPTFDHGVLYQMNAAGRIGAWQADSGKEVWAVDLAARFGVEAGQWALSENILIDGDKLYCTPGGRKGRIVALKKADGETLWANTEIKDAAAYSTPLLAAPGARRQLITVLQKSIVAVDAADGKLLWTVPHETAHDQNVTRPIYKDGRLFVSSGHGTGGRMFRLAPDGTAATELWVNKDLDNCHPGILLVGGCVYGSGCRLTGKGFVCVDWESGKTLWNEKSLGKISLTWADGLLYGLSDEGKMSLLDVSRERCRIVSQFSPPRTAEGLWLMHPIVCGGRLYLRHWNDLFVYDIRAGATAP